MNPSRLYGIVPRKLSWSHMIPACAKRPVVIPSLARHLYNEGMARRIHLRTDLSVDELERRYRAAKEPRECSWWQILWLLARGQLAKEIAESTGYSRYWIGQIAKR